MTIGEHAHSFFIRPFVLHPYLFGIYLFTSAIPLLKDLPIQILALVLILLEASFFLLTFGASLLFKEKRKGAIFITVCSFPFMFYDQFQNAIFRVSPSVGRMRYVLPFLLVLFVIFTVILICSRKPFKTVSNYLSALVACLIVYNIVLLSAGSLGTRSIPQRIMIDPPLESTTPARVQLPYQPDIYYLILDAYTSSKSLKKYWNYDNSPFEQTLESHGFFIAAQSRCLYPLTTVSMASTFNMMNDTKLILETNPVLLQSITDNEVFDFLQKSGYRTINASIFDIGNQRKTYKQINDAVDTGESAFASASFAFLEIIRNSLPMIFSNYSLVPKLAKINLDILARICSVDLSSKTPLFFYAHLMTPHFPKIFDRNGNPVPFLQQSNTSDDYLDQLIGTNILVIKTVESILKRYSPDRLPIIIIQGDHGFRGLSNPAQSDEEQFSMLNAYFFPGGGAKNLYQTVSPYNSFRILFDTYFESTYMLLRDYQ